jgi:hypothetical protein
MIPYITKFIKSLNSEELAIVKEHVNKLYPGESKIKQLLDLLLNDAEYTDKELSHILKNQEGAVRTLKSRLFDCIKEALVSDRFFENSIIFSEIEKLSFLLRKRVLLIKSLHKNQNQGRIESLSILLNDCIRQARENQLYDVLSEALTLKKYITGFRAGFSVFQELSKELEFSNYCFQAVQQAFDMYYHVIINDVFTGSLTKKERKKYLIDSIKKMTIDYKKTKAEEINYFIHILKIALHEEEKDYKGSLAICKKILLLIQKKKMLYSANRMGFIMSNLSMFSTYTGDYQKGIMYAKKCHFYHLPNSIHSLIGMEQEFYARFYYGNHSNTLSCIEDILQHSISDTGNFRRAKFIYYKACTLFKLRNFKSSLQIINNSLEIEIDKIGWNVALKILIIMNHIELGKFGEASKYLGNFRKFIERNNKEKKIKERDILIFKLLRELEKDNFFQNEHNKKATALLAELSDKNKPTAWNYFTPELIPFHEWVMGLPVKPVGKVMRLK